MQENWMISKSSSLLSISPSIMDSDCVDHQSKRSRLEEDGGAETKMESLPREILVDILSRLPITCLMKFQFVCRTWRALAQDPDLVKIQLCESNSSNNTTNPCLIFHCDYPIRNQLCFVDLSGQDHNSSSSSNSKKLMVRKFRTPFWGTMPEFDVVGSCRGLLCLADSLYRDAIFVYNPFTRDFKELPKAVQYQEQEVIFGFGFHEVTNEYKVVKLVYYRNGYTNARRLTYPHSAVQVLSIGNNNNNSTSSYNWKSIGKVPYQLVRRSSEALVNGRLHWVTRPRRYHPTRRIISFDLADDQFHEVLKPDCDGLNRCNFHLVTLQGCLSAIVNCSHGKLEIWAMKEYGVKDSWVKEFNIGAYLPKGLKQNVERSIKIWKNVNAPNGRVVRVLCLMENGDILLEYRGRVLVSYDPKSRKFKDFMIQGMPNWFQTVVHSGNLNWID